jgi:hypothetical protein
MSKKRGSAPQFYQKTVFLATCGRKTRLFRVDRPISHQGEALGKTLLLAVRVLFFPTFAAQTDSRLRAACALPTDFLPFPPRFFPYLHRVVRKSARKRRGIRASKRGQCVACTAL